MGKQLHFDCFSGASGNMILGSLLDLGVPREALEDHLRRLRLGRWKLVVEEVRRGPLRAVWCDVRVPAGGHAHRHLADVERIIGEAALPEAAEDRALRAFHTLAQAEGKVHGVQPEQVVFHEVGAVDSLIDIVGTCCAVELLEVERVTCSSLPLGGGSTSTMHGAIPVPAPATCEILRGAPVRQTDCEYELTTPTGAALMVILAERFGPAPDMVLEAIGYGAGDDRATPLPNVLRVFKGSAPSCEEGIVILETNIDNVPAEATAHLLEALLQAGALDAFLVPIAMKKSRLGQQLSVVCRAGDQAELEGLIFASVPTLGIRSYPASRRVLDRREAEVATKWGSARIKEAIRGGEILHAWPEYEDLKRLSAASGKGIWQVREEVMAIYRGRASGP